MGFLGKKNQANSKHIPDGNRDAPAMDVGDYSAEPTGLGHKPRYRSNGDAEKDAKILGKEATVDVASERSLTFGTMLRGTAANELTVFERKAALVNA